MAVSLMLLALTSVSKSAHLIVMVAGRLTLITAPTTRMPAELFSPATFGTFEDAVVQDRAALTQAASELGIARRYGRPARSPQLAADQPVPGRHSQADDLSDRVVNGDGPLRRRQDPQWGSARSGPEGENATPLSATASYGICDAVT